MSALLADYGFVSMRLSDDWRGADFIAQHVSGNPLHVQLKGRLAFDKPYRGKNFTSPSPIAARGASLPTLGFSTNFSEPPRFDSARRMEKAWALLVCSRTGKDPEADQALSR
jgi:hypothetical protein